MQDIEPIKEEDLKPIVISQFVFHPKTGEITAAYHEGLSIQDLMKIRFMVEETLTSKQLEINLSIADSMANLDKKINILLGTHKQLLNALIIKEKDAS